MSLMLDPEALDLLIEAIGEDATRGVVALFIDESRDLIAAMRVPGVGHTEIGRAAHSLKSSAGQLGAMALSEAALVVEMAASNGEAALPPLIAALDECAVATRVEFAELLR